MARDLFDHAEAGGLGNARLSDEQRLDWLRLIRSQSIGPRTFQNLINRFGGAAAALSELPGLLRQNGKGNLIICSRDDAAREMEATLQLGACFVALGEAEYPAALAAIDSPPPLLAVMGQTSIFSRPCVAIVGSRNASAAGMRMAERLASGLGAADVVIVSGLARGIDARAHAASVLTGTVAVLAGGLAKPYPAENKALLSSILAHGAVISEMPLTHDPRAQDFPRRNRIVSGIALGTIIVEAARRSGSLITARFALEQGREVFAVPGSPLDPRAEGTNDLIRNGATLVGAAQDVMEVIEPLVARNAVSRQSAREADDGPQTSEPLWEELDLPGILAAPHAPLVAEEWHAPLASSNAASQTPSDEALEALRQRLIATLSPSPVEVNDLARLLGEEPHRLQAVLFELELAGVVERSDGGRVALR